MIWRRGKEITWSLAHSFRHALASNPDVQKLVGRHPRLAAWVRARLGQHHFSGLPLTLLAAAATYLLFLIGGVVKDVLTSSVVLSIDIRLADLLYVLRSPTLVSVFIWLTLLGKGSFVLVVTVAVSIWLWVRRQRLYIIPLLVVFLGSEVFVSLAKLVFHRPRPSGAITSYHETSFSFPSSHAALSIALYGFLSYLIWRTTRRLSSRLWTLAGLVVLVSLIGFSRLYLGVHFFSDIWGGYLIGALWLVIGISVMEWLLFEAHLKKINEALDNRSRQAGAILLAVVALFYVGYALIFRPQIRLLPQPPAAKITISPRSFVQVFADQHLPYVTETIAGNPEEPINLIILAANDERLFQAFDRAHWYKADVVNGRNLRATAAAALLNRSYPTAPITPAFWNAGVHDFGFEKPAEEDTVRQRHHARFWRTNLVAATNKQVYVGTASYDTKLKWFVTHRIEPAIDTERDLLTKDLMKAGVVDTYSQQPFVRPTLGKNFAGDYFFTDGAVAVLELL